MSYGLLTTTRVMSTSPPQATPPTQHHSRWRTGVYLERLAVAAPRRIAVYGMMAQGRKLKNSNTTQCASQSWAEERIQLDHPGAFGRLGVEVLGVEHDNIGVIDVGSTREEEHREEGEEAKRTFHRGVRGRT